METFSAMLTLCAGNSPVTGEFPAQGPVTWSFDVFYDLHLNKRMSKIVRLARPVQQADLWQFIEKLEVHLLLYEHYGGDLISLSSGITGELPQCRGSRPAAPTADGWQKPRCFQN